MSLKGLSGPERAGPVETAHSVQHKLGEKKAKRNRIQVGSSVRKYSSRLGLAEVAVLQFVVEGESSWSWFQAERRVDEAIFLGASFLALAD